MTNNIVVTEQERNIILIGIATAGYMYILEDIQALTFAVNATGYHFDEYGDMLDKASVDITNEKVEHVLKQMIMDATPSVVAASGNLN